MIGVVTAVFWLASLLVVYPYLIYPLILRLLAALSPARRAPGTTADSLPKVTFVISAFNEEAVIARKLENTLALDFPADRLEVIVASDASSDRTDEIVRTAAAKERRVRLVRQEERRGKSSVLNKAVEAASGEIVVFSDANAIYEANAIRELVRDFSDAKVGYVVGAALYSDAGGKPAGESEGIYWKFELFLKRIESRVHSVVGGDGAIYAIRRHLFWEFKEDDISDFVNPLQIVAAGYRGLFNPAARCYEHAGETFSKEFRRKRRIVNRTWRAVRRYGYQLNLRDHGRFLFMLLSHKVVRWYALPLILVAWLANSALLGESSFYAWTWAAITASVALAGVGALFERLGWRQPRLVYIFYYFYVVNLAGLLGIWDEWRGVRHVTWDHIRKAGS
jgi:cellulose synthase/poly-beta-1,6-N-acetylglucosamine synthase-like glycosyltransferase